MRWERRDLAADGPPPGRWRLVLCRNVAIYLEPGARRRLYTTLAAALSVRGILLLGRSERLIDPSALGLRPAGPHAYERIA
jgi:chemotaxis protein methyltransferase CheR